MIRRPELVGEVVAHALEQEELGAPQALGRALTAGDVDQRIGVTVDHERFDVELAQLLGAAPAR